MRFEPGLEEPDPKRARRSALTIALSYVAGGLVPLAPSFFVRSVHYALIGSVMDAQYGIEEFPVHDRIDILLDRRGQAVCTIAGQAACPHHSPEFFFLDEKAGLIGQGMCDPVVLMAGMNHDVGTVESRSIGLMVKERTTRSENIPRVVDVKIKHAQPKGKVDSGHRIKVGVDCDELTLWENSTMIFEFFERVGFLGRVNPFANQRPGRKLNCHKSFHSWDTPSRRRRADVRRLGARSGTRPPPAKCADPETPYETGL